MSHAIYQSKAVILKSRNYQESNKLLVMYTRDFGLIYVAAQSLRSPQSKMKYHTLSYSYVDVDIVRGRDLWRLTGIHQRMSALSFVETAWYPLIEKVSSLMIRLMPGEEPHVEVWEELEKLYSLIENQSFEKNIEYIFISRMLYQLGYWSGEEEFIFIENPYIESMYLMVEKEKKKIIQKINQGLADSQL